MISFFTNSSLSWCNATGSTPGFKRIWWFTRLILPGRTENISENLSKSSWSLLRIKPTKCLQAPTVQAFTDVTTVHHERYLDTEFDWDIALIYLHAPLKYNDYVRPVCLPSTPVPTGTNCVVTGWGRTSLTGKRNRTYYFLKSLYDLW